MLTSLHTLATHAKRLTSIALIAGALAMTGCASTSTTAMTAAPAARTQPQVRADVVYVSAFDVDTTDVKVDGGMIAKLTTLASGSSADVQRQQSALTTRERLADALVRELRSQGIPALRGPVPDGRDVLVIEGRFESIDAGNRRRRTLIGLGAGKSEVKASVTVLFRPAHGAPQPLGTFSSSANSGHLPGMVETAGVGAAAGRLATSAAVGAGLHGVSEAKHDTVVSDTDRLARSIAKQLATQNAANAWLPTVSAS
ncbi:MULTISPECIES: DUF4410 domain-containing protein [Burkholderia]|uniref:DUF4410 domain-containing protein n=1 Tax=Burkholderia TaxID=32008 RepID=UPI00064FFF58|nr:MULTISPECIES: DUF4410 domain-containing protein [Burkholderia]KML16395.1 hypothetical protein VL00_12140 [Burkholderia cepacia]KML27660.1 hypothetical protein VL13_32095 [Burkholderia lata]KMN50979.1 hypothetical protein VK92_36155 [Burkholderia sp. LK4]KWF99419.1 hypothetical protein WL94_38630 [Burkholderia cepacia]